MDADFVVFDDPASHDGIDGNPKPDVGSGSAFTLTGVHPRGQTIS